MSGITSTVGPFSGIDTGKLIRQLLAVEARPIQIAQNRLGQLQLQQTAILDINSRLATLRDAAAAFRVNKTFNLTTAASSDETVLTATSTTTAQPGTYQFLVDRLVSTQQMLGRGFADRSATGIGASEFTFESTQARLDRDVSLSDLNSGDGVSRGKIVLTQGSSSTTVDLSKAATVSEVLDAINGNGVVGVKASVRDGKIVLTSQSGTAFSVSNGTGYTTADSLGIAGTSNGSGVLAGATVYAMSANSTLAALNDGDGVAITSIAGTGAYNMSMKLTVAGNTTDVKVNLGEIYETKDSKQVLKETTVSTVGGVLKRMNDALDAAGFTNVRAKVSADGQRIQISDSGGTVTDIQFADNPTLHDGTVAELGLTSGVFGGGTYSGTRVFAGLNTTLASRINGGRGIAGDGVLDITARDGTNFAITIDTDGTLSQIAADIQAASGTGTNGKPRISVEVNEKGTGLVVTDNTGSTASKLIIQGTDGVNSAESLGISTGAAGVSASSVDSGNLQHSYIARATQLTTLNGGKGVGTGKFRITDGFGATTVIDVGEDTKTVGQLIDEINSQASGKNLKLKARINDNGDGVVIEEDVGTGPKGTLKIKISDETGTVAGAMKFAGQATGLNADNRIDGSFERSVAFSVGDTLDAVAKKINEAGVGMSATIIKDGSGSSPYRLSLTATTTGRSGRVLVDTGSFDLSLSTLEKGEDSRVFFGASDPAKAILLTGSSNTLDNVISGVTVQLKSASATPAAVTVSSDSAGIEQEVNDFLDAFNTAITRIDQQQSYNADTQAKGPLLGDGTTSALRVSLFNTIEAPTRNVTGIYRRLADVGVEVGSGGTLTLNSERFRQALAKDPKSVEALFTARVQDNTSGQVDLGNGITAIDPNAGNTFSSLGVVGQVEELAKRYIDSTGGVWTSKKKATDTLIDAQNQRISTMNDRLSARQTILQAQFARMEQAIAQLQQQQSALSSIG